MENSVADIQKYLMGLFISLIQKITYMQLM